MSFDFDDAAVATHYDELPLWSAPFGQLILDRVPMRRGQTVIDVGCGTGFLSVELAQRCGVESRIVSVDPWKHAVDVLREKCRYLGLANVECLVVDAAALDLPDDAADVIVSNLGINNFDDPRTVLDECRRVLRPGGTLIMSTNLRGHMTEFYEIFRALLLERGRVEELDALDREIAHRATVESTRDLLHQAGFEVIDAATGSFRMRFADGGALLAHHFIRLGFRPGWEAVLDPESAPEAFDELRRRLDAQAASNEGLDLTVPMVAVTARNPAG